MGGCLQQEEKTPVQILKPKMPYFGPSQIWTPEMKMILSFTFIYLVCMCACACSYHASVKIGGQLVGVCSVLPRVCRRD